MFNDKNSKILHIVEIVKIIEDMFHKLQIYNEVTLFHGCDCRDISRHN